MQRGHGASTAYAYETRTQGCGGADVSKNSGVYARQLLTLMAPPRRRRQWMVLSPCLMPTSVMITRCQTTPVRRLYKLGLGVSCSVAWVTLWTSEMFQRRGEREAGEARLIRRRASLWDRSAQRRARVIVVCGPRRKRRACVVDPHYLICRREEEQQGVSKVQTWDGLLGLAGFGWFCMLRSLSPPDDTHARTLRRAPGFQINRPPAASLQIGEGRVESGLTRR